LVAGWFKGSMKHELCQDSPLNSISEDGEKTLLPRMPSLPKLTRDPKQPKVAPVELAIRVGKLLTLKYYPRWKVKVNSGVARLEAGAWQIT
jgi:hypothetical protein